MKFDTQNGKQQTHKIYHSQNYSHVPVQKETFFRF